MDKSREQFEAWFHSRYDSISMPPQERAMLFTNQWASWQASRAAVEIELPEGVDTREALSRGFMCDYAAGMDQGIADCVEKIVEQGLKVKQ